LTLTLQSLCFFFFFISEAIKKVPEQYQDAFNSQQYLLAATILVDSVEKLYQDDLLRIGALVELQAEIVAKKNTFHEVAMELLHNLIYLKDSPDLGEELSENGSQSGASTDDTRKSISQQIDAKDPLTIKLELMDQLVSSFFVLGKSNQAINKILERLRSELRHIIQKAVATVRKRHESNPVLLEQILSRPPRGEHSQEYPNLFYDMLQIVFSKAKEILVFHRCVTDLFEVKFREQLLASSDEIIDSSSSTLNKRSSQATSSSTMDSSTELDISSSSTTTYRLDHVWEEFQKEIQALIGYYINAPAEGSGIAAVTANKPQIQEQFRHQTRLFSFSNSSAFTLYEVSETQSFQYRSMDLGDPSPYNLPAIYPLISTFCDHATQIVGAKTPSSRLQDWIDSFISSNLLAVVKMDCKHRIDSAVSSAEAFKSRDTKTVKSAYSADDARRPLLNSVVEVYQCIKELYEDSIAMPLYSPQIHSIMESCLMSYYEACRLKYEEYTKDSEVGKTVKNNEFQKLVMTDPQWKRMLRLFKIGGNMNNNTILSLSVESTSSEGGGGGGGGGGVSPLSPSAVMGSEKIISDSAPPAFVGASSSSSSGGGNGGGGQQHPHPHSHPLHQRSTVVHSLPAGMVRSGSTNEGVHGGVPDHEEAEYVQNLMDFESAWHTGTTNAGVPITMRHMIYDPNRLANLASLHDSCYWIADKVALLDVFASGSGGTFRGSKGGHNRDSSGAMGGSATGQQASSQAANSARRTLQRKESKEMVKVGNLGGSPSGIGVNSGSGANNGGGGSGSAMSNANGSSSAMATSSFVFHPRLSPQLANLTWMLKDLSDQCLYNIYVDFRLQTCYFLDGLNGNYVYAAEDRQPDVRIVELNHSLSTAFQNLQAFLPQAKLKYLLGALPTLISTLLVDSLKSHIESINRNGVVKMVRNIFTLQQNLTGMTTFNEDPFDRARRYYELLNLNIEEVYQYVALHHHIDDPLSYTLNQYRTILELIANPKNRTLTDEQEKDLRDKYVLIPYQSEASSSAPKRH
jgi:hypothetical protein